jgi:hypothetical protein
MKHQIKTFISKYIFSLKNIFILTFKFNSYTVKEFRKVLDFFNKSIVLNLKKNFFLYFLKILFKKK